MEAIPVGINKCPIHKCWIRSQRNGATRVTQRFCPVCMQQEAAKKLAEQKASGVEKPKLKIMKI